MSQTRAPDRSREEDIGLRVAAAGSALFWAILFFGVIDLTVPFDQHPDFYTAYMLETGWGVLYTFLVGAAFLSLTVRPDMVMPLVQVALVGICLAVTAVLSLSFLQLLPAALLLANAGALSWLARGDLVLPAGWHRPAVDPVSGLVAAVVAPFASVFALDMVVGYRERRPPTDDVTLGIDHWPTQAALALAIAVVALAVAVGVRGRWSGTVTAALCVSLTAAWFGAMSVAYPDHAGSLGDLRGRLLVAWSAVFLVAVTVSVVVRRRRARR